MTTADWALIVSLCSFAVALASFIWNVWSKYIYPKPKVRVALRWSYPVFDTELGNPAISATATNHGPGRLTITSLVGSASRGAFRQSATAIIPIFPNWPHSQEVARLGATPNLPIQLSEGESITVNFPVEVFKSPALNGIAFLDGYGRENRARGARNFILRARRSLNNATGTQLVTAAT